MSFFHKIKKAVVSHHEVTGQAPLCPEYDLAKPDFEGLYETMIRLRQQLMMYRDGNGRLWMASTSLSTDFSAMLDVGDPHPYMAMASTLRTSHAELPTDRERVNALIDACLNPMKEQAAAYDALRARMVEHDKLKDEVVYYQSKVEGLKKDRAASKKAESASEKDKYERNMKKMLDVEASFHTVDALLVQDLKNAYAQRVVVFGPILMAFVVAEKAMVSIYSKAINAVTMVDAGEAEAWLRTHKLEMAAQQSPMHVVNGQLSQLDILPPPSAAATVSTATTSGVTVSEPIHVATTSAPMPPLSPASPFSHSDFGSPTGHSSFDELAIDHSAIPYTMGTTSTIASPSSSSAPVVIVAPVTNGTVSSPVGGSSTFDAINDPIFTTPKAAAPAHVIDDPTLDVSKAKIDSNEGEMEKVDLSSPIGSHNL